MLGFGSNAQVPMSGTGNYSQDFNTLASTGTNPWTDNTVISNVYSQRSGTGAGNYIADAGTATSGTIYSYGSTGASDRALGSIGSNGAGDFSHGILFENTSGGILSTFTVGYVLEQWRNGNNTTAQNVTFWYKISSSSFTALNPNANTGWTQVTALTASSPVNTTTAGALDGNLPANRVALTNVVISGLSLNPGEFIMFKWDDINHPSNDHGLAIDDVTISWTAQTGCSNTTATIDTVSCAASYTVPSGDEVYTTGGTYMDTIPNALGCDSILTINLSFVTSINYYPDTDGDGLGDNSATPVAACTPPANHVTNNNDCDDTNPTIGAAVMYYVDADVDGYGDATATGVPSCTQIAGSVTNNTDCNDNNAAIHPGATEIPNNGIDEDCNGSDLVVAIPPLGMYEFTGNTCPLVAGSLNVTTQPANATFGPYGATGSSLTCVTANNIFNHSGFNTNALVNTGEYYSFTVTPANCYGLDLNRIIFGHKTSQTGLTPIVHLRSSLDNFAADIATKQLPNDIYKTDTINLGAAFDNVTTAIEFRWYITEIGAATASYRHDNVTIYGTTNALPTQTYYADTDEDGFGDPTVTMTACTTPAGYVSDNTDCNDDDAEEFPGAIWYADTDGDGFGAGTAVVACTRPANHVSNNDDCDDTDDQITEALTYYVDADGDTYGDADDAGTVSCTPIAGSVTNNDDCDDTDEDVNPAAAEVCDGVDNNCDGSIDEGFTMTTYYEDADGDTYGNPASSVTDCTQPAGYVTNDDDCDDTNATTHPGAVDIIGNGIDDNCDGIIDGVVGIEESILAQLNVYPNPGTSSVVLDLASGWNGMEVAFIGVDGKEIALTATQKSLTGLEFNTTALVQGTYFIRLTSDSGTALVRWVKN